MPGFPTRPAVVLLAALLCLAACAPTATVSVGPTATTRPAPTATPSVAPAPTPTNVPAGWKVLDTPHLSLAYPSVWTTQTTADNAGNVRYFLSPPAPQPTRVTVLVQPQGDVSPYCLSATSGAQHTTFAGLPMTFLLMDNNNTLRSWLFANRQRTLYSLQADDVQADATTQAEDEAILATFRPDNATPWSC